MAVNGKANPAAETERMILSADGLPCPEANSDNQFLREENELQRAWRIHNSGTSAANASPESSASQVHS